MQRLHLVESAQAEGQTRVLLDTVEQAFGTVPNVAKVLANSPAVLQSYLAFSQAMGEATIGGKLHHQLKLATSESNQCEYCTSILSALAPDAGLSADEILASRARDAEESRAKAALAFAADVLESHGKVSDEQLHAVRAAGYSDGEIVEIVASVVLGSFTNFVNNVAQTELDIPQVEPLAACESGTCQRVA